MSERPDSYGGDLSLKHLRDFAEDCDSHAYERRSDPEAEDAWTVKAFRLREAAREIERLRGIEVAVRAYYLATDEAFGPQIHARARATAALRAALGMKPEGT